jgi:hypothetical protein
MIDNNFSTIYSLRIRLEGRMAAIALTRWLAFSNPYNVPANNEVGCPLCKERITIAHKRATSLQPLSLSCS